MKKEFIEKLQQLEIEISEIRDSIYSSTELSELHRAISEFLSSEPNGRG